MTNKSWSILLIITIVTSVAATKYYWPNVQEKVVTVEKEVTHTVTRIVKQPDGTVITEIDKHEVDTKNSIDTKYDQSKYFVQVGVDNQKAYFGTVGMRLFGPIFVGVGSSTNKTVSITGIIMF